MSYIQNLTDDLICEQRKLLHVPPSDRHIVKDAIRMLTQDIEREKQRIEEKNRSPV